MFKYAHNYFIDGKFQLCILLLNSHKLIYYDVHNYVIGCGVFIFLPTISYM